MRQAGSRPPLNYLEVNGSRSLRIHDELQSSESPPALLIIDNRFEQMHAAEVGPERFRHMDFCVRALPQEKVRNAQLTAGPHQQIKFRQVARVKFARDVVL